MTASVQTTSPAPGPTAPRCPRSPGSARSPPPPVPSSVFGDAMAGSDTAGRGRHRAGRLVGPAGRAVLAGLYALLGSPSPVRWPPGSAATGDTGATRLIPVLGAVTCC